MNERKTMYLSDINPELNSEINNIICESRQAKTLQERIMEDKKYWQFYKQRKEELNPKKKNKK